MKMPETGPGGEGSPSPPGRSSDVKFVDGPRPAYRGSTTLTVLLWFEMTYAMA